MVLAFGAQTGVYYDEQGNWVDTSAQEQAILQGGGQPLAQPSGYDPAAAEARAEAMYGGTMYAGGAGTYAPEAAPPPPPADPAGPSPAASDAAAAEAAAYQSGNAYSTGTPDAQQAWAPPPYSTPSPQAQPEGGLRVNVAPAAYYDRAAGMAEATSNPFYGGTRLYPGGAGNYDPEPPPPPPVTALPGFRHATGPESNFLGWDIGARADGGLPRTRGPAPGTLEYERRRPSPPASGLVANSALDVPPTYPERLGDLRTPEQRRRDAQRAQDAEDARLLREAREREAQRQGILGTGSAVGQFVLDRAGDFGGWLADRNRDAQEAQRREARGDELLRESRQPVRQPGSEPAPPPRRTGGMAGVWAPQTRDAAPPEPDASFEAVEASRANRPEVRVPPPPGPLTAIPGRPGFALDQGGPAAYGAMGLNVPPPPGVGRGPSTGGEPAVVGAGGEVAAMAAPETLLPGGPVLRAPAFHADIAGAPGAAPSLLPPPPAPRARVVAVNIGPAAPVDPDALPQVTDVRVGPPRPTIDQQIASMNAVRETPMPPEEEARMRALLAGEEPPPPRLWDQFLAAAAGLPAYLGLDNRADERMRGQRPGGVFVPAVTGGTALDDPGRPMRSVFIPEITGGTADFVPPPPGPGLGDRLAQLVRDDFDNFQDPGRFLGQVADAASGLPLVGTLFDGVPDNAFGGGGVAEQEAAAPPELAPGERPAVDARGQGVRVGADGVVRDRAGNPVGATTLEALTAAQTAEGAQTDLENGFRQAFPGDATLTLPGNATQLSPAEVEAAIAEAGLAEAPASGGSGGSGSSGGGGGSRRSSGGGGYSSGGSGSRRSSGSSGSGPRGRLTRVRDYEDGSRLERDEDGNLWVFDPDTGSYRPFGRKGRKGKGRRSVFASPIFDRYKQVSGRRLDAPTTSGGAFGFLDEIDDLALAGAEPAANGEPRPAGKKEARKARKNAAA